MICKLLFRITQLFNSFNADLDFGYNNNKELHCYHTILKQDYLLKKNHHN